MTESVADVLKRGLAGLSLAPADLHDVEQRVSTRQRRKKLVTIVVAASIAIVGLGGALALVSGQLHQSPAQSPFPGTGSITRSELHGTLLLTLESSGNPGNAIYEMNADGSGLRKIVSNPMPVGLASWSPDGSKILFLCGFPPYNVCTVNSDGTDLRQLTRGAGAESATWIANGSQIAYDADSRLMVMDADGSNPHVLMDRSGVIIAPNGLVAYQPGHAKGAAAIWVANSDGTQAHRITDGASDDSPNLWTPDSRRLLFTTRVGNGPLRLWSIRPDGSGRVRVPLRPGQGLPFASPDGRFMAFGRRLNKPILGSIPKEAIYVSRADGSGLLRISGVWQGAFVDGWRP